MDVEETKEDPTFQFTANPDLADEISEYTLGFPLSQLLHNIHPEYRTKLNDRNTCVALLNFIRTNQLVPEDKSYFKIILRFIMMKAYECPPDLYDIWVRLAQEIVTNTDRLFPPGDDHLGGYEPYSDESGYESEEFDFGELTPTTYDMAQVLYNSDYIDSVKISFYALAVALNQCDMKLFKFLQNGSFTITRLDYYRARASSTEDEKQHDGLDLFDSFILSDGNLFNNDLTGEQKQMQIETHHYLWRYSITQSALERLDDEAALDGENESNLHFYLTDIMRLKSIPVYETYRALQWNKHQYMLFLVLFNILRDNFDPDMTDKNFVRLLIDVTEAIVDPSVETPQIPRNYAYYKVALHYVMLHAADVRNDTELYRMYVHLADLILGHRGTLIDPLVNDIYDIDLDPYGEYFMSQTGILNTMCPTTVDMARLILHHACFTRVDGQRISRQAVDVRSLTMAASKCDLDLCQLLAGGRFTFIDDLGNGRPVIDYMRDDPGSPLWTRGPNFRRMHRFIWQYFLDRRLATNPLGINPFLHTGTGMYMEHVHNRLPDLVPDMNIALSGHEVLPRVQVPRAMPRTRKEA